MATVLEEPTTSDQPASPKRRPEGERSAAKDWLAPLASLKLTVALFAASLFIVLAGTFAQTRADIWEVIDTYFRFDPSLVFTSSFPFINFSELFVWIDFALFFPPAFAPDGPPAWSINTGFPFPKGWTIGLVMLLNLAAAHSLRFKVQARGNRLFSGIAVTIAGIVFTYLVIASGGSADGFQAEAWVPYNVIWNAVLGSLALLGGYFGWGYLAMDPKRGVERWLAALAGVGSLGLAIYLFASGSAAQLEDSYMRILWQLIKATLAGLVLLVGCVLLFKKRAGIVLLHAGVGLLMVGEIMVGLQASESKMRIEEGGSSNYSSDTRAWEIAVIDPDPSESPQSTVEHVIDGSTMSDAGDAPVQVDELSFGVRLREIVTNSFVKEANKGDVKDGKIVATSGVGEDAFIVQQTASKGTDSTLNMPSAYVDIVDNTTGEVIDTLLLSTWLNEQNVIVGDKLYQFALRFKRQYKPYTVYLNDMSKEDYLGTDMTRDFSARIALSDPTTGVRRDDIRIWMNNPMRYAGETFYQADYFNGEKEGTGIQIVTNSGWMIPYVACMIVAVGMVAQFGQSLMRFLDRRRRKRGIGSDDNSDDDDLDNATVANSNIAATQNPERRIKTQQSFGEVIAITAASLLIGAIIAVKIMPPRVADGAPDLSLVAALPVVKGGRAKPLDTLARNALLILSDKQTAKRLHPDPEEAADGKLLSVDAIQWLLDVISQSPVANDYRVIRIENLEVQEFMGLQRRDGLMYSMNELAPVLVPPANEEGIVPTSKFEEQLRAAQAASEENRTFFQRKLLDLGRKVFLLRDLRLAFDEPPFPQTSSPQEIGRDLKRIQTALKEMQLPLAIPVISETILTPSEEGWISLNEARLLAMLDEFGARSRGEQPGPLVDAVRRFEGILTAWRAYSTTAIDVEQATYGAEADAEMATALLSDQETAAAKFNLAVNEYKSLLTTEVRNGDANGVKAAAVESYAPDKLSFEAFFNRFAPFHLAWIFYIIAGVLSLLSLLVFPRELRAASLAVILTTFVLHTFALWARIEISGRPPVTNLYSSAVFIGWAAVLFGIGLEMIYKMGVGNIIGAVAGILTLRIAHVLSSDGDTFEVLQAVLDTQFWLATHVVTITLGYSATFVAGLLAATGIFRGFKHDERTAEDQQTLARMTYGITCFAMLFSFVGTVLGGLWADDSWGRFWGWDPKENGALMIVLANALVLHARWGKMVGNRGLFVLAVLSNIVVAWSWFGTNELGVGLHSYGFTEGRLRMLLIFILSQLIIATIAFFPTISTKSKTVNSEALMT